MLKPRLVYSPRYDFSLLGLERLHPFDTQKFSRAWTRIATELGSHLNTLWEQPSVCVKNEDLLRVHTSAYLHSLHSSATVAKAIEMKILRFVPPSLLDRCLLNPMRLAVTGTMLATELALTGHSIVINLAGGYHHAFSDHGEGFCIYADLAVAVAASRAHGTLRPGDTIAIIDLDAHRGNGTWKLFESDKTVQILDIHNFQNYPGMFPGDCDAYPFQIPVKAHTPDSCYLALIRQELPKLCASAQPKN